MTARMLLLAMAGILWLVLALLAAVYADAQGRSPLLWGSVVFVFGVFGVLAYLLVASRPTECPDCGVPNPRGATTCRDCGTELGDSVGG